MTVQACLTIWKCENCTILRYYGVDKSEISCRLLQIGEDAASDDDDHDPARPSLRDRGLNLKVQHTVSCDGPVVIERQHAELHDGLRVRALISRTMQPE